MHASVCSPDLVLHLLLSIYKLVIVCTVLIFAYYRQTVLPMGVQLVRYPVP